jgi:hypothetical protein
LGLMGRGSILSTRCDHRSPVAASQIDDGYTARCLTRGTVGPVRDTSEEAREALINLGKRNREDE